LAVWQARADHGSATNEKPRRGHGGASIQTEISHYIRGDIAIWKVAIDGGRKEPDRVCTHIWGRGDAIQGPDSDEFAVADGKQALARGRIANPNAAFVARETILSCRIY
jgi:hypothetical protein